MRTVYESAGLSLDFNGIEDALIVRDFRVEQSLQGVAHGRLRGRQRHVEVAGDLFRRACEVEHDLFTALAHRQGDLDVLGSKTVIVHDVLKAVVAVRNTGDGLAHAQIGTADDLVAQGDEVIGTIAGDHLADALHAQLDGSDLRIEVAQTLVRKAHVQQHEPHDVIQHLALAEETNDRDAQAFLVDLVEAAGHGTHRRATDVRVVDDVRHETKQLVAVEDRHRHVDVLQVRAARDVRVICDEDIARSDAVRILLKDQADETGHRGKVDRQRVFRLNNQPTLGVGDCGRMVVAFLDVRRESATHQRQVALVGNGTKAVPANFDRDRIKGNGFSHRCDP